MEKLEQANFINTLKKEIKGVTYQEGVFLTEGQNLFPLFETIHSTEVSAIILLTAGWMDVGINMERYQMKAPSLLAMAPGQKAILFEASLDCHTLSIVSSKQFREFLEINTQEAIPLFLKMYRLPFIPLTKTQCQTLKHFLQILKRQIVGKGSSYHADIIKHLFQVLFYMILDISAGLQTTSKSKKTTQEFIFESFHQAVLIHYKKERKVKFYAQQLCLTPKYLSSVIKQISNKSPNEWIDSFVILEAKRLLKTSRMTVQQICDELHFATPSFFAKYFKHQTGMTPTEYRQQ